MVAGIANCVVGFPLMELDYQHAYDAAFVAVTGFLGVICLVMMAHQGCRQLYLNYSTSRRGYVRAQNNNIGTYAYTTTDDKSVRGVRSNSELTSYRGSLRRTAMDSQRAVYGAVDFRRNV